MAWIALGAAAVLQLLAGVVRVRAWFHVIRDSWPEATSLRYRDVVLAHLGGVGWNAILPAHGGDAVKVAIVNRRMPERRLALLATTLVPPGLVEAGFTALLLLGLLAAGLVSLDAVIPDASRADIALAAGGAAAVMGVAALVLRRRLRGVLRGVRAGLATLHRPRVLATRVVPWLLAGRALRLTAYAAVLPLAGLPLDFTTALALMALQGATPSAGAVATAARVGLLATVLAATGEAGVSATDVAAALAAAYAVTTAFNVAVSTATVAWLLGTASPRLVIGYVRSALGTLHQERVPARAAALAPADRAGG